MIILLSEGGIPMKNISFDDKAELMKQAIKQLYENEGRSINYISKLLDIERKVLTSKIKEWNLKEAEPRHHLSVSKKKFLNKNRNLIKSRLDNDITISKIAEELKISRKTLVDTYIKADDVLTKAYQDYNNRKEQLHKEKIDECINASGRIYDFSDLPGEIWKPILGYDKYMVSNMGRIKTLSKSYNRYYLLRFQPNKNNGRLYVRLINNDGKSRNLQVARIVAFAFVSGHSDEKNTVNHEDGDVTNNKADNLSWMSQSKNNEHSYKKLKRTKNKEKKYIFSKIVYCDKYEFKTVAAFSRFLGKSETQVRRYLDEPKKHNIKLIK